MSTEMLLDYIESPLRRFFGLALGEPREDECAIHRYQQQVRRTTSRTRSVETGAVFVLSAPLRSKAA